jgi:hypothetical protein
MTALPHLTEHHEALFDVLRDEATAWPTAPVGEHSGISLAFAGELVAALPDVRFVHIVRDGRDAARSMQQHLALRLLVIMNSLAEILGANPIESTDQTDVDRVPAELRPFLPERFDGDAFGAFRVPLPTCGTFWVQQVEVGLKVLSTLPDDHLMTLRYEDLLIDPKSQLDALTGFFGDEFIDEDWSARCAATVRKPKSTWRDLPEEDARALDEACRPGFELLRAAGIHYDA